MSRPDERDQQQRIRDRFTRSAEPFARFALGSRGDYVEWLARMAEPRQDEFGLDLACGPGTFTREFARRLRFLYGLDLTPAMLARAHQAIHEEGLENVQLICGDAYALPFRNSSLGVSCCGYTLHHLTEPPRALAEVARVLRRGGRFAAVDLIVPAGADSACANAIERARDASHALTLTAAQLAELLESSGFRIRASETAERNRGFDDWMRVAGWQPTDAAWSATRKLMETAIEGDRAGYHPRLAPAGGAGAAAEPAALEFVQTSLLIVAEKI